MAEHLTQGQKAAETRKAHKAAHKDKEAKLQSMIQALEAIVLSEEATTQEKAEACKALCIYRGLHFWDF